MKMNENERIRLRHERIMAGVRDGDFLRSISARVLNTFQKERISNAGGLMAQSWKWQEERE